MSRTCFLVIALWALVLFSGCSGIKQYEDVNASKELLHATGEKRSLLERAMEYWHFRAHRAYEKSYQFELPSYRFLHEYKQYLKESSIAPEGFHTTIVTIEMFPDKLNMAKLTRLYINGDRVHRESDVWYLVNGTWYHRYYFSPFPD